MCRHGGALHPERVETMAVKQVLISHPFPILLLRLELVHMHWIYLHPRFHTPCRCSDMLNIWFKHTYKMEWNGIWSIFYVVFSKHTGYLLHNSVRSYHINAEPGCASLWSFGWTAWLVHQLVVMFFVFFCEQHGRFTYYRTAIMACSSSPCLFICLSLAITVIRSL